MENLNEKQQIAELSDEIQNAVNGCSSYWSGLIAESLYNADYRKQSEGEWIEERYIDDKRSDFKCSVCEYDDTFYRNLVNRFYKFCPNCGAKMKGDSDAR